MILLTYFGLAVLSALLPWVNGEVLMLSAVPLASSPTQLVWFVALVTAGQMAGKSAMYWTSRTATGPRVPRLQHAIDRIRSRFQDRPAAALGMTLVSATLGLPPFYLVSMAAGALKIAFGPFVAVGTIGRLIHFGLVAFAPYLIGRGL